MNKFLIFALGLSLSANYAASPYFDAKYKAVSNASKQVDYAVIAKGHELDPLPDHGVAPPPVPQHIADTSIWDVLN